MQLHIHQKHLAITFSFWEKVWGFHGNFSIPLDHIENVTMTLPPSHWTDMRAPGSFLPGVIKAGTYFTKNGKEYWYVTRGEKKFITIELEQDRYKRIVLSLPKYASIPDALLQMR